MSNEVFEEIRFLYHEGLRAQFRKGVLRQEWAERYPEMFTAIDCKIAKNQPRRHFFEWLGAVLLYEATGYRSYMKYDCGNHLEAQAMFCRLAGRRFSEAVLEDSSGYPDLFVYASDHRDWFFCEVKGYRDRIGPKQTRAAKQIVRETGRRVVLLNLQPL